MIGTQNHINFNTKLETVLNVYLLHESGDLKASLFSPACIEREPVEIASAANAGTDDSFLGVRL